MSARRLPYPPAQVSLDGYYAQPTIIIKTKAYLIKMSVLGRITMLSAPSVDIYYLSQKVPHKLHLLLRNQRVVFLLYLKPTQGMWMVFKE
jgi:hypothetical protein